MFVGEIRECEIIWGLELMGIVSPLRVLWILNIDGIVGFLGNFKWNFQYFTNFFNNLKKKC